MDDIYNSDQVLDLVSSELSSKTGGKTPPDLRPPHLEFICRLDVEMGNDIQPVGAPFSGTQSRIVMPIVSGTVNGPQLSGTVVPNSGADWAYSVKGTKFANIDARYTLKTHDGQLIYVRSKGIFSPDAEQPSKAGPPQNIKQSDADWFTRLRFETGPGPYNWMNGIFAVGALTMRERRVVVDAYRVTNSPGQRPQDLKAKLV